MGNVEHQWCASMAWIWYTCNFPVRSLVNVRTSIVYFTTGSQCWDTDTFNVNKVVTFENWLFWGYSDLHYNFTSIGLSLDSLKQKYNVCSMGFKMYSHHLVSICYFKVIKVEPTHNMTSRKCLCWPLFYTTLYLWGYHGYVKPTLRYCETFLQ